MKIEKKKRSIKFQSNMFRCLELIALGVDLSAAFASTSLSASLGVSIQWGEGRFFQQVASSITINLIEIK
jgi:hypothetical protein